jgi:hypothetical protein
MGLEFPPGMPAEQRRRLLKTALAYFPVRGTPEGLRRWLEAYLAAFSGLEEGGHQGFPFILEHFKLRRWMFLAQHPDARLGATGLWGPDVVGRMHLDAMQRLGDVRLVDLGHADTDVVDQYANRFSVFVPAALAPSDQEARALQRVIDQEKPAQALGELHLVEPRFRIGVQSTIGMDTILGPYPAARLASVESPPDTTFRPPRHVLGYDTVLAAAPEDVRPPSFQIGAQTLGEGVYLT